MLRISCVLVSIAAVAACVPIGDAFVRVSGSLVDETGKPVEQCQIRLFRTDERDERFAYRIPREPEASWVIGSDFRTSFLVDPGAHEYYVMIGCAGYSQAYKSDIFEASGFSKDIDLGVVTIN